MTINRDYDVGWAGPSWQGRNIICEDGVVDLVK